MRVTLELRTDHREELVDITGRVRDVVSQSGLRSGLVNVYAQGATAAIMIQENFDASVPTDVVSCLRKLIPAGIWLHDEQDSNGDAHLKAGLVGPSETLPIIDQRVVQNISDGAKRAQASNFEGALVSLGVFVALSSFVFLRRLRPE
jgi:secondary thiamine-phosphate synthase enzyme